MAPAPQAGSCCSMTTPEAAERESVVAPAQPSPAAKHKARTKRTEADQPVHSLRLLDDRPPSPRTGSFPRCPVHNPSRSSRDRPSCRAPCSGCSACGCDVYSSLSDLASMSPPTNRLLPNSLWKFRLKELWPPSRVARVCCPRGVSNREFLPRVCERIPPDVKGRRTARASPPRRSAACTRPDRPGTERMPSARARRTGSAPPAPRPYLHLNL